MARPSDVPRQDGTGDLMGITYFKRFRMERDLAQPLFQLPAASPGYRLVPWDDSLLDAHAEAKYQSFCFELDANVFPCLGERDGCRRLMHEIRGRKGFVPEATWLAVWQPPGRGKPEYCGTIQGLRDDRQCGSIQNVGIAPDHRGQGLGTFLMYHALDGFTRAGLRRASLEVTAQNVGAVRLYRRLGFRTVKTVYKAVEVAYV